MAIQKINLGTEPLGEGGDTYRSANTKINENFSNTDHAASRLVGTDTGNVMQVGAFGLGVRGNVTSTPSVPFSGTTLSNKDIAKTVYAHANTNGAGIYREVVGNVGKPEAPIFFNAPILALKSADITTTLCAGFRPEDKDVVITSGNLAGNFYNEYRLWSSKNTTKDSKTNLLLASGSEIPVDSAASRLVGTANGQVPAYERYGLSGLGYGGEAKYVNTRATTSDMEDTGFYTAGEPNPLTMPNAFYDRYAAMLHIKTLEGYAARLIFSNISGGELLFQFAEWAMQGKEGERPYLRVYHSGNTNKGTNGALTAKSPVSHLYHDRVEHTGNEKELQPIKFVKQGVGNYLLKNTTGLAQEGWYIVIPQDANGNPLIAVEYEDKDGDVNVRTYKRKFDYEQAKVVADHDNPMDIPETRWIDLRFNDDPSLYEDEELNKPEPVEEPEVVEEVEDPEVVEEPEEESK